MRNFLIFIIMVFAGLFLAVFVKQNRVDGQDGRPVLHVFASSSFIAQWGPGPWLKETFEKDCDCRVEFQDNGDSMILIQKLKSQGRTGSADVVLGFDQYDLELANQGLEWRKIETSDYEFEEAVQAVLNRSNLIPYDWSPLSFIIRKSEFQQLPKKIDDLMVAEMRGQIAIQDPRYSSVGLQFLLWLIQTRGEEKAFQFLTSFNQQVHSYTSSWSGANGLFNKGQVKTYFSHVTTPVYYRLEDKSDDVVAVELPEGHPVQYEFVGVPVTCTNCDLAEKFVALLLSKDGQKMIMEKNTMFPAIQGVKEGTIYASIPHYKILSQEVLPSVSDRERILKKWAALRRGE